MAIIASFSHMYSAQAKPLIYRLERTRFQASPRRGFIIAAALEHRLLVGAGPRRPTGAGLSAKPSACMSGVGAGWPPPFGCGAGAAGALAAATATSSLSPARIAIGVLNVTKPVSRTSWSELSCEGEDV